ncbi:uncharacterized protein PV09_05136 [Verruconis gallopava]|uniref:adenosine deaminase n=1 Tax=Verruconis gallopava TaxID=253628 RepID=A0A0D1YT74_9PEZI|nr:uncharacterized protein PV09_05136 [Verruconis gallopava]KIW03837.1 hypothetical protein PV09_05136 [Verruconis gallopava]
MKGGLDNLKRKRGKPRKAIKARKESKETMTEKPMNSDDQRSPGEIFNKHYSNLNGLSNDYEQRKKDLISRERNIAWDKKAIDTASKIEQRAGTIIWKIREHERDNLFGNIASEAIPGPETLDMGGQFLSNRERVVKQSYLYRIALKMPKGCHLHLHFNAELAPDILIKKAGEQPNMFIRSTQPILSDKDYAETEIVFNVLPEDTPTADIWSPDYNPDFKSAGARPWMRWADFQSEFRKRRKHGENDAEEWVRSKMVLSEQEVYGMEQTTNGVWARFNQATRAFKGLMNYERVFTWYIGQAIDNMIEDGVMYAELRPMLMDKSIPSNNGKEMLDHRWQMRTILEQVKLKQDELRRDGRIDKFPFGLKIIYCAPRSIPKERMQQEIKDCIRLKLEFPDLICGFDLVGAEDRANHIGFYRDELLAMVQTCKELNIDIPFMFHAGETLLDLGGSKDPYNSNLYDAVLFNAKRIGHGFSLLKHPVLVEQFKKRKICIELCPTSNELLHLCRNIKEHPYPQILAMGIPCTVNSDNPSLFTNSVSHEFYQIMVGSPTMSIHGWRQLVEWSIQFSCLQKDEKDAAEQIFKREWTAFCQWVDREYGSYADTLDIRT